MSKWLAKQGLGGIKGDKSYSELHDRKLWRDMLIYLGVSFLLNKNMIIQIAEW